MIETLKVLLNTDNEILLYTLLDLVEAEFCDYCNREDVPDSAKGVLINMARIQYARLDSQGLKGTSINGISETYDDNFYPHNILQQMNKYRKLTVL